MGFEPSVSPKIDRAFEIALSPLRHSRTPVPPERPARFARGTGGSNPLPSATESVSPVPAVASRRKGPAFPGSVSLDETTEWDVLAGSSWPPFSDRH